MTTANTTLRITRTSLASFALLLAFLANNAQACHLCGRATTDCRPATVWVEVEQEYTVKVPYTEEIEQTVMVHVPHTEKAEVKSTVMVPHTETRTTTRTVKKCTPETTTCVVSRDFGCWETVEVEVPCEPCVPACGGCNVCGCQSLSVCGDACCPPATRKVCQRVWVPDVRTKEIAVTTYRVTSEEVPCEYTVTVCHPEERTRTVDVVRYTTEERTKKVNVTRYRDEKRTRTVCVPQPSCEPCPCGCY